MPLYITRRPEVILGNKLSRWNALHNPYIFEITRKDWQVANVTDYGTTQVRVKINANAAQQAVIAFSAANYPVIYLKSGVYDGIYTIVSTMQTLTAIYLVITTPFISVGTGGWVNFDTGFNYDVLIRLHDTSGNNVEIETAVYSADSTGKAMVDIAGLLKKVLTTEDIETFTFINQKNGSISGSFGIQYKYAEDQIGNDYVDSGFSWFWLSASKQIQDINGSNFAEYVPAVFNPIQQLSTEAKFLTMFEKPRMWVGYPFSIGFIYSEWFDKFYLERHQQNNDINRQPTSSESVDNLNNSEALLVNGLTLAAVESDTKEVDVWLEIGDAYQGGGDYVDDGYVDDGYVSEYAVPYRN